jgi:hypothetical protein
VMLVLPFALAVALACSVRYYALKFCTWVTARPEPRKWSHDPATRG